MPQSAKPLPFIDIRPEDPSQIFKSDLAPFHVS